MLTSILKDPLAGLAEQGGVLAVTTGVVGSAYRPVGAAMAFLRDGSRIDSLSSGCIEEALALEVEGALADQAARQVRYGEGSPWIDIQLPCGAGLDINLWPVEINGVLIESAERLAQRKPHALALAKEGLEAASMAELQSAGWDGDTFILPRIPPLRFLVIGTGLETVFFAQIARASGYGVSVASPDPLVREALPDTVDLSPGPLPTDLSIDAQTAAVFFFHEHDYESALLQSALESPAFWVGAQGSRRKRKLRQEEWAAQNVAAEVSDRLAQRFGLIPSARDPQTLAVSVLADTVHAYKERWFDPYFGQNISTR